MNSPSIYPLNKPLTRGAQIFHPTTTAIPSPTPPKMQTPQISPPPNSNPTLLAKFDVLSVKDLDTYHLIMSIEKLPLWMNGRP